ncbi:adenosine kinase [Pseudonocardia thermophila]|uniref:Adenosine kinase n=1 Tax=Pseudonocardia thermophila TaxID=1848 RepID=A0A1M6T2B4_PSETH|nr:carbohydrate kinase family protein [Pseudonocardia thermophila]SHK50938.1 adenosine kinase [Pseudonocardia thermophila]
MATTVLVTGSVITEQRMHFPGRFADQLVAGRLRQVSLSFLVDDLVVRPGGTAAAVAYGLGVLGAAPVLVAAVGADFAEHRAWLERHGVDCAGVRVTATAPTARVVTTVDDTGSRITSVHPGALPETRTIALNPLAAAHVPELVHVGAGDPGAMLAHTAQARALGLPFAADPAHALEQLDREHCRALIDGARWLFTDEDGWQLLLQRTGWSAEEVASRVGTRVTTLGAKGSLLVTDDAGIHVGAVPARGVADPTGAGDGFRAAFLAGILHGLGPERAAQLGALVAAKVLESSGALAWRPDPDDDLSRVAAAYGQQAAAELAPVLTAGRVLS